MPQVYERLRERLDDLATGFPLSKSLVEMKMLKRLFTEEEAEVFLHLSPLLEKADEVAQRLNRDPVKTAELMEGMAGKGLLFRQRKPDHAHYYVDNGLGRYIDREEAKAIIRQNEKAGLVMQPFNAQNMGGMCSCCGDCCGVLRSLKKQPRPAEAVRSNYFVAVDREACIGCQTCLDRCQMEALEVVEDKAAVDLNRCIGCGLCVTSCPQEALKLIRKPEEQLYQPPESGAETYLRIALERGKNLMPIS